MKTFQPLAVLLTIAAFGANAIALPTEAASTNALPTLELATITDGEGTTWLGLDKSHFESRGLEDRCFSFWAKSRGQKCTPGNCDCSGSNGCWKKGDEDSFTCQPGPN